MIAKTTALGGNRRAAATTVGPEQPVNTRLGAEAGEDAASQK
jgi:hypothetical protein